MPVQHKVWVANASAARLTAVAETAAFSLAVEREDATAEEGLGSQTELKAKSLT